MCLTSYRYLIPSNYSCFHQRRRKIYLCAYKDFNIISFLRYMNENLWRKISIGDYFKETLVFMVLPLFIFFFPPPWKPLIVKSNIPVFIIPEFSVVRKVNSWPATFSETVLVFYKTRHWIRKTLAIILWPLNSHLSFHLRQTDYVITLNKT